MYFQPNRRSLLVGITTVAALATFGIAPAMAQAGPPSLSPSGSAVATLPIVEASVADLQAAYVSGRTTARAVTQAHLDRISAYDKRLQ
jgi:hypothetical protein